MARHQAAYAGKLVMHEGVPQKRPQFSDLTEQ